MRAAVIQECQAQPCDFAVLSRWLEDSCQVGEGLYPGHPLEVKVLITMINMLLMYVDDVLSRKPAALRAIQQAVVQRTPQTDRNIEFLVGVLLPRVWEFYDPLAATAIVNSVYEFFLGTGLETLTNGMALHPAAATYPEYVRLKSGAPAAYAFLCFPAAANPDPRAYIQSIPELCSLVNRVNDVLSFYKEELAGDTDNFVHMRMETAGMDALTALAVTADETVAATESVLETLEGNTGATAAVHDFVVGYLLFHSVPARYRLRELLTEDGECLSEWS